MKLVRASSSHDINLTAAGAAHFRSVASSLHFEFLNSVRRWTQVKSIERRIGVGSAVQQKIVRVGPVAADADRRALARPPIQRTHVTGLRSVTLVRSRNGEHPTD